MQVVFAHYHLNRGGVTQVIFNQLGGLATLPENERPARVGLLYSGRQIGWDDGEPLALDPVLLRVPALDYDGEAPEVTRPLADEVAEALAEHGFMPDDTLLHIHNHALGKNVSWPAAVVELARRGYRLLLQVHDFVEDFRPHNYRKLVQELDASDAKGLARALYPQAEGIHYAALTPNDREILAIAGVPADRLHLLPNPVAEFPDLPDPDDVAFPVREQLGLSPDARIVLYPVRGIRRKNIGELLLYSALSDDDSWHAITLAPHNPLEQPSFERWRAVVEELELRCLFDTCGHGQPTFFDALAAADALITTSVAEGFGMVFLEAWLAGKPLVGRNLQGITAEFEAAGIRFNGLRDTLEVPLDWLPDRATLAEALRLSYHWACEGFGIEPAGTAEQSIADLLNQSHIDFALLPSLFQEKVIRHVALDPAAARQALAGCNPGLEQQLAADQDSWAEQIEANAIIVRANYSFTAIGRRLQDAYAALAAAPAGGELQPLARGEKILEHFLRLERLHPVRLEE